MTICTNRGQPLDGLLAYVFWCIPFVMYLSSLGATVDALPAIPFKNYLSFSLPVVRLEVDIIIIRFAILTPLSFPLRLEQFAHD